MRASASQDWLDDRKDETMSQFDSPKMEITSDFRHKSSAPRPPRVFASQDRAS
jgi:hypothetical protein